MSVVNANFATHLARHLRETSFASTARYMRNMSESAISIVTEPILRARRSGAVILNYHGVTPQVIDPVVEVSHIPAHLFRKQIRHLINYYHVVSLAELVDRLNSGYSIPNDWVVLTFDDGFRNNLTCAWPILQEEGGVPITLFLITDLVGQNTLHWADLVPMVIMYCQDRTIRVPSYEGSWKVMPIHNRRQRANLRLDVLHIMKSKPENNRQSTIIEFFSQFSTAEIEEIRSKFSSFDYLTWDEARTLHSNGVDIGSHSCTHTYMRPDLGENRMRDEIVRSREKIWCELGEHPDHFCYPNGSRTDFCEMSRLLLEKTGYRSGLTTMPGTVMTGTDNYELNRQIQIGTMARFRTASAGK